LAEAEVRAQATWDQGYDHGAAEDQQNAAQDNLLDWARGLQKSNHLLVTPDITGRNLDYKPSAANELQPPRAVGRQALLIGAGNLAPDDRMGSRRGSRVITKPRSPRQSVLNIRRPKEGNLSKSIETNQ
jgi:hypothetical protein